MEQCILVINLILQYLSPLSSRSNDISHAYSNRTAPVPPPFDLCKTTLDSYSEPGTSTRDCESDDRTPSRRKSPSAPHRRGTCWSRPSVPRTQRSWWVWRCRLKRTCNACLVATSAGCAGRHDSASGFPTPWKPWWDFQSVSNTLCFCFSYGLCTGLTSCWFYICPLSSLCWRPPLCVCSSHCWCRPVGWLWTDH